MATRKTLRIRDTGLAYPTETTPSRSTAVSGSWVDLYGSKITYTQEARVGQVDQRSLVDSGDITGFFSYGDSSHQGLKNPELVISGVLDIFAEDTRETLSKLYSLLASQGLKEVEGDFLEFVDSEQVLVRMKSITINPSSYNNSVNRVSYQIMAVRVK